MRSRFPALVLTLCLSSNALCADSVSTAVHIPRHGNIYERGNAQFEQAWFLKPVETDPEELTFKLAPLLLQEVATGSNGITGRLGFGALTMTNGTHCVDVSRPVVYVHPDAVQMRGKPYARLTYLWFYPGQGQSEGPGRISPQGVRITLSDSGEPAVWEVLSDRSQLDLVFVSEKVEAAAVAAFGAPLEGRRYAAEASAAQAPRTVVARVIDDGPVAMGPIVYLKKETGDVMTLICRCMASQVRKLAGMGTYELHRWAHQTPRPANAGFWPDEAAGNRLEQQLRLPGQF
jgi:hypothetical protein